MSQFSESYQKAFKKQDQGARTNQGKSGLKAWEDDEEDKQKKNIKIVYKNQERLQNAKNNNSFNFPQKTNNNNYGNEKKFTNQDYINNNPLIVKNPTYDYENRVIDDVLETSGMSLKPTEGQLNEFIKRIKTLKNEVIHNLISERLKKSIEERNINLLTKLLYIILEVIKDKSNGEYFELSKKNSEIFNQIFQNNLGRKINQLTSDIYEVLTGKGLLPKEIKSQPKIEQQTKPKTEKQFPSFIKKKEQPKDNFNNNQQNNSQMASQINTNSNGKIEQNNNINPNPKKDNKNFLFIKKKQPMNSNTTTNSNINNNIEQIPQNNNIDNSNHNTNSNFQTDNIFDLMNNQQNNISPSSQAPSNNQVNIPQDLFDFTTMSSNLPNPNEKINEEQKNINSQTDNQSNINQNNIKEQKEKSGFMFIKSKINNPQTEGQTIQQLPNTPEQKINSNDISITNQKYPNNTTINNQDMSESKKLDQKLNEIYKQDMGNNQMQMNPNYYMGIQQMNQMGQIRGMPPNMMPMPMQMPMMPGMMPVPMMAAPNMMYGNPYMYNPGMYQNYMNNMSSYEKNNTNMDGILKPNLNDNNNKAEDNNVKNPPNKPDPFGDLLNLI